MAKKNTFLTEFKTFISRGSVVDMAVGIIVGTAFTAIVNSLVKDVLMPFIGLLLGGISFADLKFIITAATADTAEVAIAWGMFIQKIIDFLIISLTVFVMVRSINSFRERFEAKKEEENAAAPPPAPPADIVLLTEIRDLLKK
ncbi:MAG: large-conductance mechanosensitive channel protein MscL [Sphaerochaeta sp.]|jgi:large conductance mechanosensitive channel